MNIDVDKAGSKDLGEFREYLEEFKRQKILVIGDAILDAYITGTSDKLCREAPAPVVQVENSYYDCGGTANTAINVKALGAEIYFLSVIGKDDEGFQLYRCLADRNLDNRHIIFDKSRTTISKKRLCAQSNILIRLDDGTAGPLAGETQNLFKQRIRILLDRCDAVIISDYGYGMISGSLINYINELTKSRNIPIIVDAKDPSKFKSLSPTMVKPNYEEAIELLGTKKIKIGRCQQIINESSRLLSLTGAQYVVATLDEEGAVIVSNANPPYIIPCVPKSAKKSIGAGDTFISAMTLCFCAGAPVETAARLGSAAASIVLEKEGTSACSFGELKIYSEGNKKFVNDLRYLEEIVSVFKAQNKRIVFTNGCFDILHKGHVSFLKQAKAMGDVLIVALNSDASIKRIKGHGRPINTLGDRIEVLSSLTGVDYLVAFEEERPEKILHILKPDIFVKGATYTADSVPELNVLSEIGAELRIIPFVENLTTGNILEKIWQLKSRQSIRPDRGVANDV